MKNSQDSFHIGQSFPIGPTLTSKGVNFCLFSKNADRVDLLLFDNVEDVTPKRIISLDPSKNQTYHYWHVFVPSIKSGQLYGYRVLGPNDPSQGHRFDEEKILLDPYAKAVAFPKDFKRGSFTNAGKLTVPSLKSVVCDLKSYDWLILTSVNGVEALWARLRKLRLNKKHLRHLKIVAIGPATKRAIEEHGLKVNVMPEEYVAESVVASLRRRTTGKRVLLARAKVARDVIPRELRKLGGRVDVVEAYESVAPQSSRKRLRAALSSKRRHPDVITFTSSSTVKNFVTLLTRDRGQGRPRHPGTNHLKQLDGVLLASIGPVTSSTLRGLGLRVDIEASEYTIPGLIEAIVVHQDERP